jgi:hypothetical protein
LVPWIVEYLSRLVGQPRVEGRNYLHWICTRIRMFCVQYLTPIPVHRGSDNFKTVRANLFPVSLQNVRGYFSLE